MEFLDFFLPFVLLLAILATINGLLKGAKVQMIAINDAIRSGNAKRLQGLLDKDANVNAQNEYGDTPLMRAIVYNKKECFDVILKQKDVAVYIAVNAVDRVGRTALHFAVVEENESMCVALLEKDANVNAMDIYRKTPLMKSIYYNIKECFDVILKQKDVNVNAVDEDGRTALHHAILKGSTNVCRDLLKKSANVNTKDDFGDTPLMLSIIYNRKDCFESILKQKGVHVNAVDEVGRTALHLAVRNGKESMCRALLDKDANVNAKNINGRTPYEIAIINKNFECAEKMLFAMKKPFFKIRSYVASNKDRNALVFKKIIKI